MEWSRESVSAMAARSTTCSRLTRMRPISHHTAGWNQQAARTISSAMVSSQSRRWTCSSSWTAIACCMCSGIAGRLAGTMITGRITPNVIGPSTPSDTNRRARTPSRACASAHTRGSGSIGEAARRRRWSVQAPTIS
jgi:hypothetical protein